MSFNRVKENLKNYKMLTKLINTIIVKISNLENIDYIYR